MIVVQNILTGRLVYRESPDFSIGCGIKNAVILNLGKPGDLIEIHVTQEQWDAELSLQAQEQPPSLYQKLDLLTFRVEILEKVLLKMPVPPPSP